MSMTSQELALWTVRNVHTLCAERSGNREFADIPMSISISSVQGGEENGDPRGRVDTQSVRIRPDTARLLDPACVSDQFYESICKHDTTVAEGEGAEQLHGLLTMLCRQSVSGKHRSIRYSLNASRDLQLVRSYLWREGYDWRQAEGIRNPLKIIDVRHALTVLAGISRTLSLTDTLPKALREYDLDAFDLNAMELCRLFGVRTPNDDSESSALLRLLLATRKEQYVQEDESKSGESPDQLPSLKALGGILDHLEGLAGVTVKEDEPARRLKQRARRLVTPVRREIGLTRADIGLMWRQGAWFPVAPPPSRGHRASAGGFLYALPDGRPLTIEENMSAPLVRLDLLASGGHWDATADERLRRICGWEGEPISLQALLEAYRQSSGGWPPPDSAPQTEPAANFNMWTRMSEGMCEARHYSLAGNVLEAISKGDVDRVHSSLAQLAEHSSSSAADGSPSLQILLYNLRLCASRASLLNDQRKVWLRQMACLLDPDAWPDSAIFDMDRLPVILFGDGAVARHNRIAVASRASLGIPASHAVGAALSAPPHTAGADPAIH